MGSNEFPSPEELWERMIHEKKISDEVEDIIREPYHIDNGQKPKIPRYYQRIAINRTIESIANGKNRILLVMATGTGKTFTAFQIAHRLWKSGTKKKILYLADRNILIDQTMTQDFKPFEKVMTKVQKHELDSSYEVFFALYQQLVTPDADKQHYEDFIIQINNKIKDYLGKELIDILNPNFTTTDKNSTIICKLSAMNAFKKYFEYKMNIGISICGIPYIILEGSVEDYKEILKKINFLKKYDFNWYVDRIIHHINKMIEAKEGNIDTNYFKSFIQDEKITESMGGNNCLPPDLRKKSEIKIKVDYIKGWFLDFFAYYGKEEKYKKMTGRYIKIEDFNSLAEQILVVPFKMEDRIQSKIYEMKFNVGFFGCSLNSKKEVCPSSGWNVSNMTKQDKENFL